MSDNEKEFKRSFQPSIKLGIVCLILFCILVSLGIWQIARGKHKNALQQQQIQKNSTPPIELTQIKDPSLAKDRFTKVTIPGIYINKYTFLLDNQIYQHQVGYRVITVAQSPYLPKWILVDRGWVPRGSSRETLPELKPTFGLLDISGVINTIPSGIVLKPDEVSPEISWPIVIQAVNFEFISKNLEHPIYDFLIQLYDGDPAAYIVIPSDYSASSSKNYAYAMQWFSFAILVLIYYLFMSRKSN
jgi:surfeit locus 1 family protein